MTKNISLEQAYLIAQENCGIKAGDRVKVLRKAESHEAGWDDCWVSEMSGHVGDIGVVKRIGDMGGINISFDSGFNWNYPWFVLELISSPPKKPSFSVVDGELIITPRLTKENVKPDPLGLSIERYEVIVEYLELHPDEDISGATGAFNCPLCIAYRCGGCAKCPVKEFTGYTGCTATPYIFWGESKSLTAAKAELWFLRALKEYEDR